MKIYTRELEFGEHRVAASGEALEAAPYMLAGRRMYALGLGSGELGPIGAEHLVGEMGGIWAHPLKVADGVLVELLDGQGGPLPAEGGRLTERLSEVAWAWRSGDLRVERRDRVLPDAAGYGLRVALRNVGAGVASVRLRLRARLKFLGCWFGAIETGGAAYRPEGGLVVGEDGVQAGWGVAFGAAAPPAEVALAAAGGATEASLDYELAVAPGGEVALTALLAAAHGGGAAEAAALWRRLYPLAEAAFAHGHEGWAGAGLPALSSPDGALGRDFALAQANLAMLEADYPDTGAYFLAGLPEYPQLFGCDTAYSVPGATAAGFGATARAALETLAAYAARACGRVPHELTTNGRVFNPGNIQETPQLAIACRDYLRWSGDLEFARRVYPACREGVLELVAAHAGPGGIYPYGDGMVERLGMGSRKLDAACYTYAGLAALAELAEALGRPEAAAIAERAAAARERFDADWWMADEGLYGDSMHSDGSLQLDGHWTQVLPVQLGLTGPERSRQLLDRLEAEFVNEWGLVHTRGREELVWTLPTGLLALAAFANGRPALGMRLTENIALTARHGTLGTFKELIPAGLCFVQLWSAALYVQAILEGLLGLRPEALRHRLGIEPSLPPGLGPVSLRGLRLGGHLIDLTVGPEQIRLHHREGPCPLTVSLAGEGFVLEPGAELERSIWKGGGGVERRA